MFEKLKKILKSVDKEPILESDIAYDYLNRPDYDPEDPANTRKAKKYPDDGWHQ
jgi:hypothetical protein